VPALQSAPSPSTRALNVGRATGWLCAINVLVHAARALLLSPFDDEMLVRNFAFEPELFFLAGAPWEALALAIGVRVLASLFMHGDLAHLVVNMAFLLAFGSAVERRIGAARFVVFYLATGALALGGAVALFWFARESLLVVGASGAISGLFGAASRYYFRSGPTILVQGAPRRAPSGALLAVTFILVNVAFGLSGFDPMGGYRAIAWEVHVAGFVAGWLGFPLFDRRRT
jgi:membrane associated rhomboid family serine protease